MPLEPLSYEACDNAFQAFLDHSTSEQAIVKCIQDGTTRALEKIAAPIDKNRPFTILGIGSGNGDMDLLIIQSIAVRLKSSETATNKKTVIQNVILEPSSLLLQKFRETASSLPLSLTALAEVSFEWRQITFQEYKLECQDLKNNKSPSFDFIHFIHSIYYMDASDSVRSCYEQQLGEKGAILCLVQTEQSYFAKAQKKFKGRLTYGSGDTVKYTKEDLVTIATENSWVCDVIILLLNCFEEPSYQGNLLLDWLTHQKNFRATADQGLFNEVMDFIQELTATDEAGHKFLTGEMAAVVIEKGH